MIEGFAQIVCLLEYIYIYIEYCRLEAIAIAMHVDLFFQVVQLPGASAKVTAFLAIKDLWHLA